MALNLYAVPPHVPFLDAIARDWLSRGDDPLTVSRGLILLPTRRSARALAETFLRVRDGRPMLLPRITALGALDEAPLTLAGALDLPPAVEPMHRLAALSRMILAMNGAGGAPCSADRAWLLAQELASLMDEADRAGIDLAETLPDAADPAFAAHWAQTLKFLHIVTTAWPAWLADNGVMNPAARQAALLDAQARAWQDAPPAHRVLIAGVTAGIPAVARLLRVVARMQLGQVVLPHLDLGVDDAAWNALDPAHPQAGLARLLADLGATRGDVRLWPDWGGGGVPESRFRVLSRALLPAAALHDWMDRAPVPTDGISRLTPADQQQEAQAIALVLRDALEAPGAQVALVTPDRDLAGRVAAALLRFGIVADDSAGEPLADTPPAVFLRLLVNAIAEDLAPVPLLALLKHPLAAAGLTPIACREAARRLEIACLRGPRPIPGIAGLRMAADKAGSTRLAGFLVRLETCLEPALRFDSAMAMPPDQALAAVIEAAERLAATPDASGPVRLWAGEEGEALAERLAAVRDAVGILPDLRRGTLPGLLDAMLQGAVVRSRRALRGRGGAEHPRVFIWGLLEARLQSVDLIVLGGLAETVWPPAAEPGPWLSRPMRAKVGLPAPEETVGQAAHDFLSACCSAPRVVLSCPVRRDSAPAVPARWLTRLDMFLAGRQGECAGPAPTSVARRARAAARQAASPHVWSDDLFTRLAQDGSASGGAARRGDLSTRAARDNGLSSRVAGEEDLFARVIRGDALSSTTVPVPAQHVGDGSAAAAMTGTPATTAGQALVEHPASAWARALDLPAGAPTAVKPPRPRPPVRLRPRRLSVTAIETWLRDPYAIHACHILNLNALAPLDEATDAADYGSIVHDGLHRFLRAHGADWPADAADRLCAVMRTALAEAGLRPALQAWWTPRLERIAEWVAEAETERRRSRPPVAIATEASGGIDLLRPGGIFRLNGRADRIELYEDGSLAILDYKTGRPPSQSDVDAGLAPQLLLEAAIAAEAGFGPDLTGCATQLVYWYLSGGIDRGTAFPLFKKSPDTIPAAIADARARLCALIDDFDRPERAYLSRPHPGHGTRFSDYEQLARVAEWSAAGDSDE